MANLLVGNSSTSFATADTTGAGKIEAFQYTAKETGTLGELEFRTNATANTGVTSLILGVYTDSSGTPGSVLGQKTFSGTPGTSSWIKVSGLSVSIVSGTIYWLALLPIGGTIHYNTEKASGGTGDKESSSSSNTSLISTTWGANFADGPVGYQGLGVVASLVARPLLIPPTFFTPKGLYKPFPVSAEEIKKKEEQKLLAMLI